MSSNGEWIPLDSNDPRIPYHLRDNAPPLAVCDRCGRHTWNLHQVGANDQMTQPTGAPCGGTLQPMVAALPQPVPELADFNPETGHRHMCSPTSPRHCRCAAELYTLAARLDETQWALVQRASDAVAAAHGVRGHRYPRNTAEAEKMRRLATTEAQREAITPEQIREDFGLAQGDDLP